MGQKTHPLGFRLGITQEHQSVWYANFNQYASILEEDDKIRTYINKISRANYISKVKIYRNVLKDHIQLTIETGKPGILVDDMGNGLKNLLKNLKKSKGSFYSFKVIEKTLKEIEKIALNNIMVFNKVQIY